MSVAGRMRIGMKIARKFQYRRQQQITLKSLHEFREFNILTTPPHYGFILYT
jgi:hypothetical protein